MLQPSDNFWYHDTTSSHEIVLEQSIAGNLPLLFPELVLFVKTGSSINVVIEETTTLTNSANPNADGVYDRTLWSGTIAPGLSRTVALPVLNPVAPVMGKVSRRTVVSWDVLGASAEVLLSVRGLIESSIRPDPMLVTLA